MIQKREEALGVTVEWVPRIVSWLGWCAQLRQHKNVTEHMFYSSTHSFTQYDGSRFCQCLCLDGPLWTTSTAFDYFPKWGKGWKVGNRSQDSSSPARSDCDTRTPLGAAECVQVIVFLHSLPEGQSSPRPSALPRERSEGGGWGRGRATAGRKPQPPFSFQSTGLPWFSHSCFPGPLLSSYFWKITTHVQVRSCAV